MMTRDPAQDLRQRSRGPPLRHRASRPAVALRQPHRQGRARAPSPRPLPDDDARRDLRAAGRGRLGDDAHCYLWVPNALLPEGLAVLAAWGFAYKSNVVWHKVRKDGGPDGRGVGFYFRNVTELILFGIRGRTPHPGRRPPPGEHDRDPQARALAQARRAVRAHRVVQPRPATSSCSAAAPRDGWTVWGNQASDDYRPDWDTYAYNSGPLAAE